jgi:RNA polymerase sigma-70 factor (ECF subfamily)
MQFEGLYTEYYPRVYRLCLGYVGDADEAKDLTQETFIAIWKALPGFRGDAAIGTWVFRIATNNCLRHVRKAKRHSHGMLPEQIADVPVNSTEESVTQLYRCIAQLKEAERILISLVLEGLPQAQIAVIVGISEGNVRVKVHRIKERLAQLFKNYGTV